MYKYLKCLLALAMTAKSRLTGNLVSLGNLTPILTPSRIGIGSTTPQYSLDVVGDINYTGTLRQNGVPTGLSYSQTGIGATVRTFEDKVKELVSVKDFGAVGDGISDDTVAIQNAINAHGKVYVPPGIYRVSSTITLTESYSGLIGDAQMPFIYRVNPSTGPTIKITASGTNLNEFTEVANIAFWHCTIPGTVDPGIAPNTRPIYPTNPASTGATIACITIDGSPVGVGTTNPANPAVQRTIVRNIRVIGWGLGVYVGPSVNTLLHRIFVENHTDWTSSNSGITINNKYIGYYFNCTPVTVSGISPMASIEIDNCLVNGNFGPTSANSFGFYASGTDLRDIFFTNCETAGGNYGFYIEGSGYDWNWDIHIIRPIVDAFKLHGIVLKNLQGPSCASIIGGYVIRDPSGSGSDGLPGAILLENCDGCYIGSGIHVLGFTSNDSNDDGIRLYNSTSNTITGIKVVNCRYGISVDDSSLNIISNNTINASPLGLESNPVLSTAIRVFNSSNANIISNNTIRGASGITTAQKYSEGVYVESGSVGNQLLTNVIEGASVLNPYNIGSESDNALLLEGNMNISGDLAVSGLLNAQTPNVGSTGAIRIIENPTSHYGYLQFVNSGLTSEYSNIAATLSGDLSLSPQNSEVGFNGKILANGNIRLTKAPAEFEFNAGGPRFRVDTINTLRIHTGGGIGNTTNELMRLSPAGVGIGTTTYRQTLDVEGAVLATGGFISVGSTTPIKLNLVGNKLTFTATGIGSTTFTLS
jgi:parallel beta-helix repeat protein